MNSEAFTEGYNAYWNNGSFLDNPYEPYTKEYYEWRDGWSANQKIDLEQEND